MSTTPSEDLYALFGVDPHADDAELRRAWRRLAFRWHPDRAGPEFTPVFQDLSAAWTVLGDPASRARYDRSRGLSPRPPEPAAPKRRRPPSELLTRVSGPLASLLAAGIARRGADGIVELGLLAEERASGGTITVSLRVPVVCPACGGSARGHCSRCERKGWVEELFSAWLTVRPGALDGAVLTPSVGLRGMIGPVEFRVRAV